MPALLLQLINPEYFFQEDWMMCHRPQARRTVSIQRCEETCPVLHRRIQNFNVTDFRPMNPFDILIVVILGYSLVRGLFRGLVKEVSSIIGVLGGFYAAYTYYMVVGRLLAGIIKNTAYLNILSFLVIFCGVFIVVSLLGVVIKYLLNIAFLGWVDRLGGFCFGIIKGVLIVAVLFITFTTFLPKRTPLIKNSVLSPHVSWVSEKMAKVVSKEMKREFWTKLGELKKAWKIPK